MIFEIKLNALCIMPLYYAYAVAKAVAVTVAYEYAYASLISMNKIAI
jgi:hypothetical protein